MPLLPAGLQRKLVAFSKDALVLGNRWSVSRYSGKRVYDLMLRVIIRRLASVPGVRALYLCHSMVDGECYPGLSDFDLVAVFDGSDISGFHARMRARWGSLRRYFPINDLSILTADEFSAWQACGGGWDPMEEVRRWQLIAGEELRSPVFDPQMEWACQDRLGWALGHFQNLLAIVLKQEQQYRFMAIVARRQLHKSFWHTVLTNADHRHSINGDLQERIAAWTNGRPQPETVSELQEMHRHHFLAGPVTRVRFEAAALAYRLLENSLRDNPLLVRDLPRPLPAAASAPIENHAEVLERTRSITASLREALGDAMESVILASNGSARGYALHVVLRDGLSDATVADTLRDMRAIWRVFDDLWLNEHLPGGIPTVGSRSMFLARLQTGRSGLHFLEEHRVVLHGTDLYAEFTTARKPDCEQSEAAASRFELKREQLTYSLHFHQVYMARSIPALYELVTFYLPRLMMRMRAGVTPATVTEAVRGYADLADVQLRELPLTLHARYAGRDLDYLMRELDMGIFERAWPMLQQGLLNQKILP